MKSEIIEVEEDCGVLRQPPAEVKITGKDVENNTSDDQAATCRICMDSGQRNTNTDDALISPCMCKGTQQFVHRSCLNHWRSVKEGHAFSHCTTCKAQFHLRVIEFENKSSWRKIKFRLFVARDVILVCLAIQTVIGLMGGLAYLADKHGSLRNCFNDKWDRILSRHPIPFYYCVGFLVFLVLLGIVGIILYCCSAIDNDDPINCCFVGNCDPNCAPDDSMGACCALVIVVVVILLILGIVFLFFTATVAIQRICQKHYHFLTKKELTQEYVVEDLHGSYTPAKLDPTHEERLKNLKLF